VGVAGDQLDARQATSDQAAQEPGPGRAVLGGADIQPKISRCPSALRAVATSTAVEQIRPPSRTRMLNASIHTSG
jgi:hypothetical protein